VKRFIYLIPLILFFACTRGPGQKDQINIALPADISTLDPANCYDTVCYLPLGQVYETLYEIEYLKRPYSLRPLLAEGFPVISRDKLQYTFKIKKGIKYHPSDLLASGREVKAQDFITQIKRLAFQGTRSQGFWLVDQKIQGINQWRESVGTSLDLFLKTPLSGVSAPDDHTLVIQLVRPYPQLLWAMAMSFTSPVPEEVIFSTQNDLRNKFLQSLSRSDASSKRCLCLIRLSDSRRPFC
jgi:ABC-type transport system substrate-binding protein